MQRVYDLKNAGPKNRLMIMTKVGPVLVHNCNQSVARDFMAEAMLRLEKADYEIILTVHDEIIAEVDKHFGNITEFENIMKARPSWAPDCPIDAKGWAGTRYHK
jgi:DNA polymerase